ncbi:MAG: Serine/threonine-protein kinase PknB [Candidatus Sulfotelmatobacter sp.]|nr:Serine/threonine-protein kinase PknB [Candidatus Sulfotelmatobacter sp.]
MPNRNPNPDPRAVSTGPAGVSVPAKGDSSPSDLAGDPDATLVDLAPPSSDPAATLVDVDATFVDTKLSSPRSGTKSSTRLQMSVPVLQTGVVLAGRYEILQLLGEGGMGAVYKAMDRELDRPVALKLIRPELASRPAILARFKQELLLAHQVTHKNVIRIYDLGDADGVKFITMEFVEGQDLRALILERKKFSPEDAVEIIQQVCRALEAAHSVGVIHRDLKPQNIMRDQTGRILVMDFGLARTVAGDGMTQTGALVGTMEYMSPEQALAKDLDHRSDLFTLGLILYELLAGVTPYKAESAIASLIKRNQERAIPVSDHDEKIPRALSNIVSKCLERDPVLRYQNAGELLRDLDAWQGNRAAATLGFQPAVEPWGRTIHWPIWTGIAAVVVLAIVGFLFRGTLVSPSTTKTASGPALSLAILPFRNASGDPSADWLGPSLADMLSTDVGQSARLRTVSQERLHQVLSDLRIAPNASIEPATLRRLAEFSNADKLVWGQYAKFGGQIRIDATLLDLKDDRSVPIKIEAVDEKDIPGAVDRLAESIRQKLALPENVLKELKASSFQPNSSSVEALRDYDQGIVLQRGGKILEAQKQFEAATKADSNFALAFSKLAQSYSSLGYDSEAEQSARRAVELSQNLPEAEKYLISAIRWQITKNYPEAIKAYENLAHASPDNTDVQSALASVYEDAGDFAKAREYYQKLLLVNPKDLTAVLELGRVTTNGGDPQGSLEPLNRAYSLSIQLDNQEQKAASLHAMAIAYRMLGKPADALHDEQEALIIWHHIGQKRGEAASLNEMANAQALLGKNQEALSNFQQASQLRREIGDKRGLGDTMVDMGNFVADRGDHDQALKMYKEGLQIERDMGNEGLQATLLNNIGSVYSEKGQYEDALTYFQQALQLREKANVPRDIVEAVHNLGEVSLYMGQYDQAIAQYMRALALRRSISDARGAAIESYSLGTVFLYQGRFGAAVNAKQEALKTFQDLKDKTFWMAEMLGGYGEALIQAGRADEANTYLNDAVGLARELKNDGMVAQSLDFQGDAAFYRGDSKSARSLYEQAIPLAIRSKEPEKILNAKADLAKVDIQQGHGQAALKSLRPLVQQAESLGLKYIAASCSIVMAEALVQNRDFTHARQELGRVLLLSDKWGTKPLSARAHFLLATIARESDNSTEAQENYRTTLQLIDGMRKEQGADKILQRSDLKTMFDEATRWSQSAKM